MKKLFSILVALSLFSSLFLFFPLSLSASVMVGYSIAPVGEMSPLSSSFGSVGFSAVLSPWSETHAFDIELEALLSPVDPYFNGVNLKLSSPLFLSLKHPFAFIFPNVVYWSPRISVGVQYRLYDEWNIYLGLAPFSFQDTDYTYEFLSPYALYNIKENAWGYGAYIMRFTVFFGG